MKRPQDPFRRGVMTIYLWILLIGGAYFLWIRLTGKGFACAFNSATGLLCPGCGSTRMFLDLLRLDLVSAWRHNGAVLVVLLAWNAIAGAVFWGRPAFARRPAFLYGALFANIAVLVVFGILRNL